MTDEKDLAIIFRGDILEGHTLAEVKARLGQLFKLSEDKVNTLFSGKPVTLKKQCDRATADKYQAALTKAGARVEVRSIVGDSTRVAEGSSAPTSSARPNSVMDAPVTRFEEVAETHSQDTAGEWSIAPPGADVLGAGERAQIPVASISVEHLQVEKPNPFADAMQDMEEKTSPETVVDVPDLPLATVGADLLEENERRVDEPLELDLSEFSLDQLGADLLRDDERADLPVMEVEVQNFDVAPVGADLEEAPKDPPPPAPNTDHLSLAK